MKPLTYIRNAVLKTKEECISINQDLDDEWYVIQVSSIFEDIAVLIRDKKTKALEEYSIESLTEETAEKLKELVEQSVKAKTPCDRKPILTIYKNERQKVISALVDKEDETNYAHITGALRSQFKLDENNMFFFSVSAAVFEKISEGLTREKAIKFFESYLDEFKKTKKQSCGFYIKPGKIKS